VVIAVFLLVSLEMPCINLCRKSLCAGYFMNAAEHIRDGNYVTVTKLFSFKQK